MTLYDGYGERKRQDVLFDTWGHLAPEPGRKYEGWILATYTAFGDVVIIDWNFDDLLGSPWQAEDFDAFMHQTLGRTCNTVGVYVYHGWYKKFKNDGWRFKVAPWKQIKIEVLD